MIDGLSLWAEIKRLEQLARNRYLDTPSSSPAHVRYCEQMQERTRLKEMVSAISTIAPIHAAGACYCKECKFKNTFECSTYAETSNGIVFYNLNEDTDFCSHGERSEQNATS